MRVRVILNPRAGAGDAARFRAEIELAMARRNLEFDVRETAAPGAATRLAAEARADGIDVVAIVGGDGTVNEVAQAYVDASGAPVSGPDVSLIPAGTGGDFRRTFGFSGNVEEAVARLVRRKRQPLDLGVAEIAVGGAGGGDVAIGNRGVRTVAFLNILSFGVSGLTCELVNAGPKWLGGRLTFLLGAVRASLVYSNEPVEILVDGAPWHRGPIYTVAIANGRYFGGGMLFAPDADPHDGKLDVVAQCDLSLLQQFGSAPKVYKGTHLSSPLVKTVRAKRVHARPLRPSQRVLVEADGESPGALPLSVRIAPGALHILV